MHVHAYTLSELAQGVLSPSRNLSRIHDHAYGQQSDYNSIRWVTVACSSIGNSLFEVSLQLSIEFSCSSSYVGYWYGIDSNLLLAHSVTVAELLLPYYNSKPRPPPTPRCNI